MEDSGPGGLSRTASQNQSNNQQARPQKKRIQKDKGFGAADFYSQFMGFEFENKHEPYQNPRPRVKKYSYSTRQNFKKTYLQGNFRFFMDPNFEKDIRYLPPDDTIPWEHVEQVKYITNSNIHCPICLNEQDGIVVPQITRCGHIYCWPCILRHLSSSKGGFISKCPLCSDFIIEKEIKSADVKWIAPVLPGEPIKLKLVKRNRNDNIVHDADTFEENYLFSRVRRIGYQEIVDIHTQELILLKQYAEECLVNDEKEYEPYAQAAILKCEDLIKEAEAKYQKLKRHKSKTSKHEYIDCTEDDFYYFYQEASGLNIFLSPTCYKYLKSENGTLAEMPREIESDLLEMEAFQQNEKTRKRHKFLSHIPVNADIKFAEVSMSSLLSFERLHAFDNEVKIHRERNQPKEEEPIRKKSNNMTSPKDKPLNQSEMYEKFSEKFINPPVIKELKLDDASDYPELPSANLEETKKFNERAESLQFRMDEKKKEEKETVLKQRKLSEPIEEFKGVDDYLVKEGEHNTISDFIFMKNTSKPKKSKGGKNKHTITLIPNFY